MKAPSKEALEKIITAMQELRLDKVRGFRDEQPAIEIEKAEEEDKEEED